MPKSPWGQATHYMLGLWPRLTRYLEEGRVELDNNLIENALRPLALGRKNYLFAGSHDAALRAAMLYSLLGTCKLHGVNPQEWLTDVFQRIPMHPAKRVEELLPHHWQKAGKLTEAKRHNNPMPSVPVPASPTVSHFPSCTLRQSRSCL